MTEKKYPMSYRTVYFQLKVNDLDRAKQFYEEIFGLVRAHFGVQDLDYVLKSMVRYWKETLQIFYHAFVSERLEWTEITVEELFDRLNSDSPPLLIDVRSPEEFNGTDKRAQ